MSPDWTFLDKVVLLFHQREGPDLPEPLVEAQIIHAFSDAHFVHIFHEVTWLFLTRVLHTKTGRIL